MAKYKITIAPIAQGTTREQFKIMPAAGTVASISMPQGPEEFVVHATETQIKYIKAYMHLANTQVADTSSVETAIDPLV